MRASWVLSGVLGVACALSWCGTAQAGPSDRRREFDHVGQFNFIVELGGITVGRFESVSGLSAETKVKEDPVPPKPVVRKVPGRSWWSRIICRVGMIAANAVSDWYSTAAGGSPEPRAGAIVLRSDAGTELWRYEFSGAWPTGFRVAAVTPAPAADPEFPALTTPVWDLELVIEQADIAFTVPPVVVLPGHRPAWELRVDGVRYGVFDEAEVSDEPRLQVVEYTVEEILDPASGIELITYTDASGTEHILTHRPTGFWSFPNIVLHRGTVEPLFWGWERFITQGIADLRQAQLVRYDARGRETDRLSLSGAWPCSWKGWALDGKGGDVVAEEVELAVEEIIREAPNP